MTILMLEAIAPWIERPARAMSHFAPVTALQHVSFRAQKGVRLDRARIEGGFTFRTRLFPPGFAGMLEPVFTPLIRAGVNRCFSAMQATGKLQPHVICPFPYAEPWVRDIPGDQLVYYNVDDYELYDIARAGEIRAREDRLIRRAKLTICVAQHQADVFRRRHPDRAERIVHIPHGLAEEFLNPDPATAPQANTIGYVGNLTDRVDWTFVDEVVQQAPDLMFEFVGRTGDETTPWAASRASVMARSNVRFIGPVPQSEVPPYYWRSAVNWMPYDIQHPFNIASSPTKIFDAFASGRPFASTAIPEVACYPDRIMIAHTPQEMTDMLRQGVAQNDAAQVAQRLDFARGNLWQDRAEHILELLGR